MGWRIAVETIDLDAGGGFGYRPRLRSGFGGSVEGASVGVAVVAGVGGRVAARLVGLGIHVGDLLLDGERLEIVLEAQLGRTEQGEVLGPLGRGHSVSAEGHLEGIRIDAAVFVTSSRTALGVSRRAARQQAGQGQQRNQREPDGKGGPTTRRAVGAGR